MTSSSSPTQLVLLDTGNLVLRDLANVTLWQSFNSPTDTLLPTQPLTKDTQLISSRSHSNFSSGFYKFYFDNDNVLRLLYNGLEVSSVYWPNPLVQTWENGRTTYNNTREAAFNELGCFKSSDDTWFQPADFGLGPKRRLTLDFDGNIRMYSQEEASGTWHVSWQAISQPCMIHGICGPNSLCSYAPKSGRICSCLPGYKKKNNTDSTYGCELESEIRCNHTEVDFLRISHVDLYGYDIRFVPNTTFNGCRKECLQSCDCKAFMLLFRGGVYNCYPKYLLVNGHLSPNFDGITYIKLPKVSSSFSNFDISKRKSMLNCSEGVHLTQLERMYKKPKGSESLKFLLWFVCGIGGVEMTCVFLVWRFLYKTNEEPNAAMQGYILAATGFKQFSYVELKNATRNFTEEIGRGAAGIVYKGMLSDGRVAAIKRLNEANQGEAEFLAEVSTIGKLNHMNLIEMWGYCAEGKHRLLVYEYMKHGSLAENISSNAVKWEKRFEIAVGTAKGLAYLHEECLEWILHCDVKPKNILLDSNFQPKVADFGLSKLLNRSGLNNSSFSKIRGTRGYMAPEWIYNHPITSKVDVYSYGIVVLEMVTGKSPIGIQPAQNEGLGRLVTWVRERVNATTTRESCIGDIVDPFLGSDYDVDKVELLVKVALNCLEEDKDARPSMRQVVQMLLCDEDN